MIKVVNIKGLNVFPIFKNGQTSIVRHARRHNSNWLINEQCGRAEPITVFLRRPRERFVSGVHSYIEFEKRKNEDLDVEKTLLDIRDGKIVNEHFIPQYQWLKDLASYYNGILNIKTVNDLRSLIDEREEPSIPLITRQRHEAILCMEYDLKQDEILFNRYVSSRLPIGKLLREVDNALS